MDLSNPLIGDHAFLAGMFSDGYFPHAEVEKVRAALLDLCEQIEQQTPADLAALYALTHAATERVNELQESFDEAGSEIETVARECIASDVEFIAHAYGFDDADREELIAPRDW